MGTEDLIAEVLDNSTLPTCPENGEQAILWALSAARTARGQDALTAAEAAELVTRAGRQSMSRQAAQGHLKRLAEEGLVHRTKRRSSADDYSIMAAGEARLAGRTNVVLVDPAKALQETRGLEKVLGQLKGPVAICDPYLDSRTFDFIGCMTGASSVKILTERVTDEERVKRELPVVSKQIDAQVEVRKASKGILHDRYVIHDGGMLILGTSLNSFGMKQSFISTAGNDVREATKSYYAERWKASTPL